MKYFGYILLIYVAISHPEAYSQTISASPATWGCDSLTVTFSQTSAATSYLWNFGDSKTSTEASPSHTYNKPGIYKVNVVLDGTTTISFTDSIRIYTSPKANIEFRSDTTTESYLTVALKAIVNDQSEYTATPFTYSWNIDGVDAGTNRTSEHTFSAIGTYNSAVIVSDAVGCKVTATKTIEIVEKLNISNVFSPNSGLFKINSINDKYYLNFQLFTRAGLLVYKTNAKTIVWDGKMTSGENIPAGVYFYLIDAEDSNPHITQKGFLYIYR
jgi:gliding motility-associated-like protein